MEVRVLGPLEVRDDSGALVTIPGGQQRTLLVLLALNPGIAVSADRLVDEIWGEATPQQPVNALHIVVSKLRRAVGATAVERRPPGYALALPADTVDAHRFEREIASARASLNGDDPGRAVERYDAALALWRGAALEEFADVRMAADAASRLDELRASAVEERLGALLAVGRLADVVSDAVAAVAQWPYRERLRVHLMTALYRAGRQAEALRAFNDAREVLADDLGLEPGAELRALEAAILAQDPSLHDPEPAARTAQRRPLRQPAGNVPVPLTSFVGRAADMAAVDELLDTHRLVTLVGPGGCGKTRLALEVASARRGAYPGAAWFVALDSISAGSEVDSAVAGALGFADIDLAGQPGAARLGHRERLLARLADGPTLLVLDNCEHVIDDVAALVLDLVRSVTDLTVLATSREAMRVAGEATWPVPPLTPRESAELFVERARAAAPAFDDRAAATDLEELCRGLDGMPLAIELLAARANAFTVAQMRDRLDDRFRLVTGGQRGVLPRHQTLRAVTDWSHDLLFDVERAVFRRMSVFPGGCTLEAAEHVCADDVVPRDEVADTVARLVDKSLVIADEGRYRMLITLSEYGREQLAAHDETDEVARRMAGWLADLAMLSFVDWREVGGRDQTWWMRSVNAELDNVRRSLEWALGARQHAVAGRLACGLGWYWWHSGRAAEGTAWIDRVLRSAGHEADAVRGLGLTWLCRLALDTGDMGAAELNATAALEALSSTDDPALASLAEAVLTRTALARGDHDAARAHARRATAIHAAVDRPWNQGITAVLRATEAALDEDAAAVEREFALAVERLSSVGDVAATVIALDALLRSQWRSGATAEAEHTARRGLAIAERYGLRGWQAVMANELGAMLSVRDDPSADELRAEAVALAHELGLGLPTPMAAS